MIIAGTGTRLQYLTNRAGCAKLRLAGTVMAQFMCKRTDLRQNQAAQEQPAKHLLKFG